MSKKVAPDEAFVGSYVEFRSKLATYLDGKKIKVFEKELAKSSKRAQDYLEWAAMNTAMDLATDLLIARDRGTPEILAAQVEAATTTWRNVMDATELWIRLPGGLRRTSKNFVKFRKEIRKFTKAQIKAKADGEAKLAEAAAEFEPEVVVDEQEATPAAEAAPAP